MPVMTSPTREQFLEKANSGNLIPVWREVLADMETPVSAFRKIAGGRPNSFLLESVEGGERLARYSFLGSDPFLIFRSKGDTATITEGEKVETLTLKAGDRDPLHVLKELLGRYTYVPSPELPPFVGGAVGMIGYDTVRFFEKLPALAKDDLGLDDCLFLFTDALLVFDNVKHKILALCNARIPPGADPGEAYDQAAQKVDELLARLKESLPYPAPPLSTAVGAGGTSEFIANRTEEDYKSAVLRAKEYIAAGDTFPSANRPAALQNASCRPIRCLPRPALYQPVPLYVLSRFRATRKLIGASPEIFGRRTKPQSHHSPHRRFAPRSRCDTRRRRRHCGGFTGR